MGMFKPRKDAQVHSAAIKSVDEEGKKAWIRQLRSQTKVCCSGPPRLCSSIDAAAQKLESIPKPIANLDSQVVDELSNSFASGAKSEPSNKSERSWSTAKESFIRMLKS